MVIEERETDKGPRPTDIRETTGECLHCGATEHLVDEWQYGHERSGHMTIGRYNWRGPYCLDRVKCWARRDRYDREAAQQKAGAA